MESCHQPRRHQQLFPNGTTIFSIAPDVDGDLHDHHECERHRHRVAGVLDARGGALHSLVLNTPRRPPPPASLRRRREASPRTVI